MTTYHIRRFRFNEKSRKVRGMSGLTLEQAQAHCSRPDTHARGVCQSCGWSEPKATDEHDCPRSQCGGYLFRAWFDGYAED